MEALRGNNGFTLDIWSMLYDYMAQDFFIRKDFLGNFLNGKSLRTWGTVLKMRMYLKWVEMFSPDTTVLLSAACIESV